MKKNTKDLTKGSIFKKLMVLSLPIMLSNLMMTLYNLTDAFWLGKIGEKAADAVSVVGLTFPIIFFLTSFGFGFTVAGSSLIAQYKGADNSEKIKKIVGQFFLIIITFALFFLLISEVFMTPILKLLNTPETIFEMAAGYFELIVYGMVFMFLFLAFQSVSQGLGDTFSPMIIQVVTITLNIILDPLMIFGIGFFPKMLTIGAGWATMISRLLAAIIAIVFFIKKYPEFIPTWNDIKPDKQVLKKIFDIAVPSSLTQSTSSFGFLILQGFVNSYGVTVISAYTIGNRLISLFMMPAMGISRGLASVIGQNLGARKYDRAKNSVRIAMLSVLTIMTLGCAGLFFFGAELTHLFIDDPAVIEIGRRMFKIVSIAANIFGILFVLNGVFNGSGHTKPAMFYNMARLWLFRIPLVFILSGKILEIDFFKIDFLKNILLKLSTPLSAYSYDALWWSMLISNILSTIWAYTVYKKGNWLKAKIHS